MADLDAPSMQARAATARPDAASNGGDATVAGAAPLAPGTAAYPAFESRQRATRVRGKSAHRAGARPRPEQRSGPGDEECGTSVPTMPRAGGPMRRVRTVKLATHVHPDVLAPYLYGERGIRSMNAIMDATGCTIDYCALSPGEAERVPATQAFVMNFLVSADTSEQMEDGVTQLHQLVDRVQVHLQKKARSRHAPIACASVRNSGGVGELQAQIEQTVDANGLDPLERYTMLDESTGISSTGAREPTHMDVKRRAMTSAATTSASSTAAQAPGPSAGDMSSKREPQSHHPEEIRWQARGAAMDSRAEEAWGVPPVQRVYYSTGGRHFRREQPRYTEVVEVDSDEKSSFESSQRPGRRVAVDPAAAEFVYRPQQRGEPAAHFVTRRRVRRRPEPARYATRSYSSRNDEYVRYPTGAQPNAGEDHATRLVRPRQPLRQFRDFTPGTARFEDARFDNDGLRSPSSARSPQGFVEPGFAPAQQQVNPYGDEVEEDENEDNQFSEYDEIVDLTRDGMGVAAPAEYMRLSDRQPALQHARQAARMGYKRPLGARRGEASPATTVYQHVPYIYEYVDDEDDQWISDEENVAMAYGYPPHYQRMDAAPHDVRRKSRCGSMGSGGSTLQWGSPARLDRRRVFKRRRVSYHELPLEEASAEEEPTVEVPSEDSASSPAPAREELQTTAPGPMDEEENAANAVSPSAENAHAAAVAHDERIANPEGGCSGDDALSGEDTRMFVGPESDDLENRSEAAAEMVSVNVQEVRAKSTSPQEQSVAASDSAASQHAADHATTLDQEMEEPSESSGNASKNDEPVPNPIAGDRDAVHSGASTMDTGTGISPDLVARPSADIPGVPYSSTSSLPSNRPTCSGNQVASPLTSASPALVAVTAELDEGDTTVDSMAIGTSLGHVEDTLSASLEGNVPAQTPVLLSNTVQNQELNAAPAVAPAPTRIVNDTIQINDQVISSLGKMNAVEADYVTVNQELAAQKSRFRATESDRKCRHQLEVLCGVIYDLQCRIGTHSSGLGQSLQHEMLTQLDSLLEGLLSTERTLQEKVDTLQAGLQRVLAKGGRRTKTKRPTSASLAMGTERHSDENSEMEALRPNSGGVRVGGADGQGRTGWEDDGWFEDTVSLDPTNESSEEEKLVAQISPKDGNLKLEGEFFAIRREGGSSRRCPQELPSFVWSFLAQLVASGPQSYVMRVTHKRLLEEISNCDPYYYLHPTELSSDRSSASSSSSPVCEFGCRGASAVKWVRKLVSQISSRMKSFDNVAYSLARSSGGKEVLNRKKMNSIIRKLHLVAMQLHSLVSHLYCVKGQSTCKEVDSLPIALNNSHFERKMGVYKSRLKLVVPHKYQHHQHQQHPHQLQNGSSEPAEELLRDTYEFFPELLLCVDIWGYNYREGHVKRCDGDGDIHASRGRTGMATTENALFPFGFFREVENRAFDFEHDGNGLLRRICDELLNIVCLWNDFKWTDNLDSVALERVVSFEADVTTSILKILELHAHHLQAVWAVRLLDNPERLRGVHFTQLNAYYSDKSRGRLTLSSGLPIRSAVSTKSASLGVVNRGSEAESAAVEDTAMVANDPANQRSVEEYWTRKSEVLSLLRQDGHEVESRDTALLSIEGISSWDQSKLTSYLLRWSDVYAARTEISTLSTATQRMLTHEVHKLPSMGDSETMNEGDFYKVDAAAGHLLAAVGRAQILSRDAVIASEKLALHFAANQLPLEKKHTARSLDAGVATSTLNNARQPLISSSSAGSTVGDATPAARTRSSTASNVAASGDKQNDAEQGLAFVVEEVQKDSSSSGNDDKDTSGDDKVADEDVIMAAADEGLDQPELKDLIQLLAVTKHEIEELCSHRPRSARVREKLQTQSMQLARQAVEIFRNITNMYAARRR